MTAPNDTVGRTPKRSATQPNASAPVPEPSHASACASAGMERALSNSAATSLSDTTTTSGAPYENVKINRTIAAANQDAPVSTLGATDALPALDVADTAKASPFCHHSWGVASEDGLAAISSQRRQPGARDKDFRYQCAACRINIATLRPCEPSAAPTSAHGTTDIRDPPTSRLLLTLSGPSFVMGCRMNLGTNRPRRRHKSKCHPRTWSEDPSSCDLVLRY